MTSKERGCYVMEGVTYTSHVDGSETSRKATDEEVLLADALLRTSDELRGCSRELAIERRATQRASNEPRELQRYSIHGVLTPISENGVAQIGLTEIRHATVHDVYLQADVDRVAPNRREDVIRTRAFWSPDHKELITAYVSVDDISLMDDDGDIYEPAGDEQTHGTTLTKESAP